MVAPIRHRLSAVRCVDASREGVLNVFQRRRTDVSPAHQLAQQLNSSKKVRHMAAAKCMQDKVVVVTGAGRGIGRGMAMLAAAEGAKVVVNDLGGSDRWRRAATSQAPAEEVVSRDQARPAARPSRISIRVAEAEPRAQAIVKAAVDTFGRVDAVINNAGILRDRIFHRMSDRVDLEAWSSTCTLNGARSTFQPCRRQLLQGPGVGRVRALHLDVRPRSVTLGRRTTPPPSSASSVCRAASPSTWPDSMSARTASPRSPGAG